MTSANNPFDDAGQQSGSAEEPTSTVSAMSMMNADDLLKTGEYQWCPSCGRTLIRSHQKTCRQCAWQPPSVSAAKKAPTKTRRRSTSSFQPPEPDVTTVIADEALAGLRAFDNNTLWIVVAGKPITQGSMQQKYGRISHQNSAELMEWRNAITKEALRLTQGTWKKLDIPVILDVALTVPFTRLPADLSAFQAERGDPRIPPMLPPDVDKLLRAVQDSLSPQDNKKKGEAEKLRDRRFLLLQDDSRIIDSSSRKTFPRPRHTHSWALDYPGAVIRVSTLDQGIDPFPYSTLADPGPLPAEVVDIEKAVRQRTASHGL